MRTSGLGLALLAAAQLTVLSTVTPAFADGTGHHDEPGPSQEEGGPKGSKKAGWIVLGVGAGVGIAGIILDCVGLTKPSTAPGEMGTTTTNARTNFFWGGTSLIVAGIVTGVVGGAIILHPDQDLNKKPGDKPVDDASGDAVTHAAQATLQSAPQITIPIVGATF